jgi:ankyrin repeat protein
MKKINRLILLFSLSFTCLSHATVPDIHRAVSDLKFEQVQRLLAGGTNVNFVYAGFVPLHLAVIKNSEAMVQLLLSEGANVDATTGFGSSPLHFAAQKGSTGIAKLLIDKGADVTALNNKGKTPLDLAVQHDKREIATLLRQVQQEVTQHQPAQQTQSNRSWLNNTTWLQRGAVTTAIAGLGILGYQLFKRR